MRNMIVASMAVAVALSVPGLYATAALQDDEYTLSAVQSGSKSLCVTGEGKLVDGQAVITLPGWFEKEAGTKRIATLTCKDGFSLLSTTAVANGKFTVTTNSSGNATQAFFWSVMAEMK